MIDKWIVIFFLFFYGIGVASLVMFLLRDFADDIQFQRDLTKEMLLIMIKQDEMINILDGELEELKKLNEVSF